MRAPLTASRACSSISMTARRAEAGTARKICELAGMRRGRPRRGRGGCVRSTGIPYERGERRCGGGFLCGLCLKFVYESLPHIIISMWPRAGLTGEPDAGGGRTSGLRFQVSGVVSGLQLGGNPASWPPPHRVLLGPLVGCGTVWRSRKRRFMKMAASEKNGAAENARRHLS